MATSSWFVEVVHVTSRHKQQEVLTLFGGVSGLTAWGVSTGHDHFVGFGGVDDLVKNAAEVLLSAIDHDAICTYVSGPHARGHMTPSPWAASLN
jgi:hypothetical protein